MWNALIGLVVKIAMRRCIPLLYLSTFSMEPEAASSAVTCLFYISFWVQIWKYKIQHVSELWRCWQADLFSCFGSFLALVFIPGCFHPLISSGFTLRKLASVQYFYIHIFRYSMLYVTPYYLFMVSRQMTEDTEIVVANEIPVYYNENCFTCDTRWKSQWLMVSFILSAIFSSAN